MWRMHKGLFKGGREGGWATRHLALVVLYIITFWRRIGAIVKQHISETVD